MTKCPNCGSMYIGHIERVETIVREHEDSDVGLKNITEIGRGTEGFELPHVQLSSRYIDNCNDKDCFVSLDRRNGVRIICFCEGCHKHTAIIIREHKGIIDLVLDVLDEV